MGFNHAINYDIRIYMWKIQDIKIITDVIDWFQGKVQKNQIMIVLLILLIISVTLNIGCYDKMGDNIRDNGSYRDSIHLVYQKAIDTCHEESKRVLLSVIEKQERTAQESEKNKRETEKLVYEYQKLYLEHEAVKPKP